MIVDFFKPNEQNAPTVENYLFSKELSQVMNGEFIQHNGQHYQVTAQTMPDVPPYVEGEKFKPMQPLVVFVYPVQRKLVQINLL